eukprot:s1605_g4.t1
MLCSLLQAQTELPALLCCISARLQAVQVANSPHRLGEHFCEELQVFPASIPVLVQFSFWQGCCVAEGSNSQIFRGGRTLEFLGCFNFLVSD